MGAVTETGGALHEQRILIVGDGAVRVSIAEMLATAAAQDARRMVTEARQNIWLADSSGVVTATSEHSHQDHDLAREVLLYAKDMEDMTDLHQVRCSFDPASCRRVRVRLHEAVLRSILCIAMRLPW